VDEIQQDLDALADDTVRSDPLDVGDEPDAAGVMLVSGVVKA
jgi:hypothetical protein